MEGGGRNWGGGCLTWTKDPRWMQGWRGLPGSVFEGEQDCSPGFGSRSNMLSQEAARTPQHNHGSRHPPDTHNKPIIQHLSSTSRVKGRDQQGSGPTGLRSIRLQLEARAASGRRKSTLLWVSSLHTPGVTSSSVPAHQRSGSLLQVLLPGSGPFSPAMPSACSALCC